MTKTQEPHGGTVAGDNGDSSVLDAANLVVVTLEALLCTMLKAGANLVRIR